MILDHQWFQMRFQTISEIQENTTGQLMAIGGTVWGPKVPIFKGTEVSLSYVQCFLYPVSSTINVSVLHIAWLDTFWTDLVWFQILHCNWPLRNYNLSSTDIASKIISKIIWKGYDIIPLFQLNTCVRMGALYVL